MVFDFEPGKKHRYERLVIEKKVGVQLWAMGRCGQTFHMEPEFRKSVVLVAEKYTPKVKPTPGKFEKRYEGPIDIGMSFDFEPGKKHQYERLRVTKRQGENLWCMGRCGETFHTESEFRNHVVPVAA